MTLTIDIKTFWRPFLLFSWRKRGTYTKTARIPRYSYRTRNGCYWNTCKLEFTHV